MKQYVLGVIALVTAITLNSFTLRSSSHPTSTKNYIYLAYPNDAHSNEPGFYQMTGNNGSDPLPCQTTAAHTCGVVATDDGTGLPDLTIAHTFRFKN